MFTRPWVCASCIQKGLRVAKRRQLRYQSTATQPSTPPPPPSASITQETIYPALLARARTLAAKHQTLTTRLEHDFSSATAKKAGELSSIALALQKWDKANDSLQELRRLIRLKSTDPELRALAEEDLPSTIADLNNAAQSLSASLVPKHPFADLPCLIEVRPGVGGGEAGLFASDLLAMYRGYCAANGLHAVVVDEKREDKFEALMEATISVETPGAYGLLRCEAGVHRVQRVPRTETMGRVHTSAASVMVLPALAEGEEDGDVGGDSYVDPADVRTETFRASGAGGQHVNKTESAVRLIHGPTNTVVACQTERSQMQNKKMAWRILRSRIAQARREKREDEMLSMRRSVVGVAKIGRGDKIRTYNWSQQRITDHRSGISVNGIEGVMEGGQNLEKLMESVRKWMVENEVQALMADAEAEAGTNKKKK